MLSLPHITKSYRIKDICGRKSSGAHIHIQYSFRFVRQNHSQMGTVNVLITIIQIYIYRTGCNQYLTYVVVIHR